MSVEDEFLKYSRASHKSGKIKNRVGVDLPGIKSVVPMSQKEVSRKEKFDSMRVDECFLNTDLSHGLSNYLCSHADSSDNENNDSKKSSNKRKLNKSKNVIALAICACLAIGIGVTFWFLFIKPVRVVINSGISIEVDGEKDIARALEISKINTIPGDFVAVDGSILENNKGEEFAAEVNDVRTTDIHKKLHEGDRVKIVKGNNTMEEFTSYESKVPFSVSKKGNGPIHEVIGNAADGVITVKTGKISGKVAEEQTMQVSNIELDEHYCDGGSDKVIALTIDDGPTEDYTPQILDILEDNGAKATFFTIGNQIKGNEKILKRAFKGGNQICTHTFTHAKGFNDEGDGLDLNSLDASAQHKEIECGLDAIEKATGETASRIIRAPGGSFTLDNLRNISDLNIRGEIGWTIDTEDWKLISVNSLIQILEGASSGDIILCHDGGGNRTNTIMALKIAIPYLKKQGFKFVTIDELMQYPATKGYSNNLFNKNSSSSHYSNSKYASGY